MSPFRLDIDLPSSTLAWEAASADEWSSMYEPGETLAGALTSGVAKHQKRNFERYAYGNDFASSVLVHGLVSLGWDMNHRNLVGKSRVNFSDSIQKTLIKVLLLQLPRWPSILQGRTTSVRHDSAGLSWNWV